MKYKKGDKVRIKDDLKPDEYGVTSSMLGYCGKVMTVKSTYSTLSAYYLVEDNAEFIWHEDTLEPADSKTLRMADGTVIGEFAKEGIIGEFKGIPIYATGGTVSIHDLPTEALPQKDDAVRGKNHFCDGFRGGKIPTPSKPVSIEEQLGLPKGVSIHDLPIESLYRPMNIEIQPLELVCNEEQAKNIAERLAQQLDKSMRVSNALGKRPDGVYFDETTFKEDKNLKFTFYTVDTSRIDKTNNTKVDTIMTCVHIGDKVGYATCDKEDYDEREGILNAIANLCCDGSFDKAYRKAVKEKKISETLDRTCSYCRKVFDTVEERQEHEAWHVECRKARHERYLLRKRAKEIAFEEAAQKMAKEMIK